MNRSQLEHVIRAAARPRPRGPGRAPRFRQKDRDYVRAAIRHRLVTPSTLHQRLGSTPVDPASREHIARQIDADSAT